MTFKSLLYPVVFLTCFCCQIGVGQILSLSSTNIGSGNFNIQTSFTGNNSCVWSVTLTCPTCTPTSQVCTGVSTSVSCTVTFRLSQGSNMISASAVRTGGSGPQCGDNISASLTVLPVELSYFGVVKSGKAVELQWVTASETNNHYFTIERSQDGKDFEDIGQVKGAGNSTTSIDYSFMDEKPLGGQSYYRVKQTDFDGQYSYSPIKTIVRVDKNTVYVSPQTTDGRLTVYSDMDAYQILLYNNNGQVVRNYPNMSYNQELQIDDVQSGIYYLRMSGDAATETVKIVKL